MKKLILILCLLLTACSSNNNTKVIEKTVSVNEMTNIESINDQLVEIYRDCIDFIRIQDNKILFAVNDRSIKAEYTTRAAYAYDLSTGETTPVLVLADSNRVMDACLFEDSNLFNMYFGDYYRLDRNGQNIFTGNVSSYTMMPDIYLFNNQYYTFLTKDNTSQLVSINSDLTCSDPISNHEGEIDNDLSGTTEDYIYYYSNNVIYIYDGKEMSNITLNEESVNSIVALKDCFIVNGETVYSLDGSTTSLNTKSEGTITHYAVIDDSTFVYTNDSNETYLGQLEDSTLTSTNLNLPVKDDTQLLSNNGTVYACFSNTNLDKAKIYEITYK